MVAGGVGDSGADVTYDQAQLAKTALPAALTLQQYLNENRNLEDLGLSHSQKRSILTKMKEADARKQQSQRDSGAKQTVVNESTKDILAVMQAHHVHNGLYRGS